MSDKRWRIYLTAHGVLNLLVWMGLAGILVAFLGGAKISISLKGPANPCLFLAAVLVARGVYSWVNIPRHRVVRAGAHLLCVLVLLTIAHVTRQDRVVAGLSRFRSRLLTPSPRRTMAYRFPALPAVEPRRNLILVTLDTLRADHLRCYGYRPNTSPNLDRLAEAGVRFDNVIVQMPATVPSHAAILTGCYPWTVQALSNAYVLPATATTVAERLRDEGYATAGFVSCSLLRAKNGFAQGFKSFVDQMGAKGEIEVPAPVRVNEALQWLAAIPADRPFALWLHLFDPHAPYEAPEPFCDLFRSLWDVAPDTSIDRLREIFRKRIPLSKAEIRSITASYDGEIAYMDQQLGHLFAWLADSPYAANTVVAVIADHGEELYQHDFFIEHTHSLYQGVVRAPLIIWHAGIAMEGRTVSIPVESVDLVPTLLDLLGHSYDEEELDGRSFAHLLALDQGTWERRVLVTRREVARAHRPAFAVLGDGYKYIHFANTSREDELYNLADDPYERQNLLDHEPARASSFRTVLRERFDLSLKQAGPPPPKISEEQLRILRALGYVK